MSIPFYCLPEKAGDDARSIQDAVDAAVKSGVMRVIIPRMNINTGEPRYDIGRTIYLPSGLTLTLDGCHLRMADGTMCNMFANESAYTEAGLTREGEDCDISVVGTGGAVIDGGEYNGLSERNSLRDGNPHILANTLIFLHNVRRFRVENVRVVNMRWWAMTFMFCRGGVIRDIDFCADYSRVGPDGRHYPNEYPRSYGEIYVKNADGIDLRAGCSDILIENITGFTEDDTIALTALSSETFELKFAVERRDTDIHDVTVRDLRSDCGMCANLRLLCSDGNRVYNVSVDGVTDMSDPSKPWRAGATVRINDHAYFRKRAALPDEMSNITIRNVISRAQIGVSFNTAAKNVLVSGVRMYGGGYAVANNHGGTFERLKLENLTRSDGTDTPLVKFDGCEAELL